ncbi:nucleotidyltransferase domain-containing protein [Microbacteriaceae bacterium VKM Ac-2854]|nr:nucleotidyltransferase domain-containing protein [Microbacteriaceae bacterium VKM Ac-2854]
MDLGSPGSDLLGATEASLLRALNRLPLGSSGRRLAKLAGVPSHSTALRALARLEANGLLESESIAPSTIYRINRSHFYWPSIERIFNLRSAIDNVIQGIAERSTGESATIAVFGSFVREEAGPNSDLDLVVVVNRSEDAVVREALIDDLESALTAFLGNPVQIVDLDDEQMTQMVRSRDPLIESWRREARTIVGQPLNWWMRAQ